MALKLKRSHKTLTLAEKQEIVQKLNSGVRGKVLAEKYRVGKSTISDIKKNKQKIMNYIANCASSSERRKTVRNPDYPEMENELYKWFQLQREKHANVTTNILRQKAIEIYSKYYDDNKFIASRGWLDRFKSRRGIRRLKVVQENLANDISVRSFLGGFKEKMKELNLLSGQIYNADESTLFWKLLPDACHKNQIPSKERVSFLACTNGDGSHKVQMMVAGNPVKNDDSLPVDYYPTKNARITSSIFVRWFHESFVMQVKKFQRENNLNGKAILLVENSSCHATETQLTSDDGRIITMFLPPDCVPFVQPMTQNMIRLTKQYYRKSLLVHLLNSKENTISNFTLKDALFLLENSWSKLSPEAIAKCWKNIFCNSVDDGPDDVPKNSAASLLVLNERWTSVDEDRQEFAEIENMLRRIDAGNHRLAEAEIQEWIVGDEDHLPLDSEGSSSEEDVAGDELKVGHDEAIRSFSACIQWAEENRVEQNSLTVLRLLWLRAMEAKQRDICLS